MRKILIMFVALLIVFVGVWVFQSKTPSYRPDYSEEGASQGVWWNSNQTDNNGQWMADPEIPDNYLPVPEKENLYMVVDENGNIQKYRQRLKQDDGSWSWQDAGQGNKKVDKHEDGSYTETETLLDTRQENGWNVIYQTDVIRTYDASGNLISTQKEGPTEIKRTQIMDGDTKPIN